MITITIDKVVEKDTINIETPFYFENDLGVLNVYEVYGMITDDHIIRITKTCDRFDSDEYTFSIQKEKVVNFQQYKDYFLDNFYWSSKEEFEKVKKEMEEFLKTI